MRIAILWRGPRGSQPSETRNFARLEPVFTALAAVGVDAVPIVYCDEDRQMVRETLLACDG